ncbi:MAG: hypothetical protein QXT31_03985, partial [Candidatus Bathyarchaeia archaeon]
MPKRKINYSLIPYFLIGLLIPISFLALYPKPLQTSWDIVASTHSTLTTATSSLVPPPQTTSILTSTQTSQITSTAPASTKQIKFNGSIALLDKDGKVVKVSLLKPLSFLTLEGQEVVYLYVIAHYTAYAYEADINNLKVYWQLNVSANNFKKEFTSYSSGLVQDWIEVLWKLADIIPTSNLVNDQKVILNVTLNCLAVWNEKEETAIQLQAGTELI